MPPPKALGNKSSRAIIVKMVIKKSYSISDRAMDMVFDLNYMQGFSNLEIFIITRACTLFNYAFISGSLLC
jgi:hypothetical protein